ncbi:scaffold attachment factor B1 isoform X1 [Acyrthosiphon pisum]|uniref:RRM domain-containing protein n=1 Tax=Acyrthosiphon pisum TaxID=7029 RepID=A0A8R1X160_ACYPI|nr:scaffold attachment factor B1 isoform X1 [Acyrthosiphon pisum]|eukprot:XP_008179585.1 PREDICTED: scaffold attachment factor B1 [Acyrthosiphon pisum]
MLTLNSKSPTVEKKLSPVIEKNEINTVSTSDKKKVTPSKTIKTNVAGKRPGPKSKTCVPQLKIEKMTSNPPNKNDLNSKQADSNDVVANSKDSKILLLDASNADITDIVEAESKKIDTNTAQQSEAGIVDLIPTHKNKTIIKTDSSTSTKENNKDSITSIQTDNVIVKTECNDIKQTTYLDSFDTGVKCKVLEEECTINPNRLDEEKNKNIISRVKEVTPDPKEEEDNIQDEELDHEIYEELDPEVDGDKINESSDSFNQTHNTVKSVQEYNKDDNNEDSINLTIGEDDIKLFADEEDTNIEKEDEVIENHTKEVTSTIKQRESCHLVTASSRSTTGLVKSRRSATEKRLSVGDKPRSTRKEDKDTSNAKPIINVSVPKDEKKEVEKQVKDKVEAGNKQSNSSMAQQISNDTSKKNNSSFVRNIWVSGLSSITKATDLKQLFSKYGKVVGAKVVTNAKTPGARCYGFVTLSSAEDANRSIENLHKTELHGRVISVERAKRDNGYQVTAKSSDSFKVNENSENDQKTKNNEEKKDKREEKR